MKLDEYGEVVNGPETYHGVAETLETLGRVLIGWTDEAGTHLDLLFVLAPLKFGTIQRGLHNSINLLFVSVVGFGTFGFDIVRSIGPLDSGYVGSKLGLGDNVTAEKLTEFINEVLILLDSQR